MLLGIAKVLPVSDLIIAFKKDDRIRLCLMLQIILDVCLMRLVLSMANLPCLVQIRLACKASDSVPLEKCCH
jgi:hypothetical protein